MSRPIFRVAIAISVGLLVWAAGYYFSPAQNSTTVLGQPIIPARAFEPEQTSETQPINGQALYISACQSCHQPSGQGLGKVFPPLNGSDRVTQDPQRLALIVLQGMTGAITIDGQTYNGFMPGFNAQFSDAELAALLSYILSAWNNAAAPISAQDIQQARTALSDRKDPWRGEEELQAFLQSMPAPSVQEQQP